MEAPGGPGPQPASGGTEPLRPEHLGLPGSACPLPAREPVLGAPPPSFTLVHLLVMAQNAGPRFSPTVRPLWADPCLQVGWEAASLMCRAAASPRPPGSSAGASWPRPAPAALPEGTPVGSGGPCSVHAPCSSEGLLGGEVWTAAHLTARRSSLFSMLSRALSTPQESAVDVTVEARGTPCGEPVSASGLCSCGRRDPRPRSRAESPADCWQVRPCLSLVSTPRAVAAHGFLASGCSCPLQIRKWLLWLRSALSPSLADIAEVAVAADAPAGQPAAWCRQDPRVGSSPCRRPKCPLGSARQALPQLRPLQLL